MPEIASGSDLLNRLQSLPVPAGREKARWIKEFRPILFTTAIILAVGLLYVWQHIQVIRLGYRVERLNAELSALVQEEKELTVRIAQLKSLARIEEIARRRLGMVDPAPSQIVVVSSEKKPKTESR